MVFCSNPVNGGTARIFYESVKGLSAKISSNDKIFPCINVHNKVEIYRKIPNLVELPIRSAEDMYPDCYGGIFAKRVFNTIKRSILYRVTEKNNIKEICNFINKNKIDAIIIHNGGYVGDDLCNQALAASYLCASITKKRIYILHNDMQKNILSKIRFYDYDNRISKQATDIVTVSEFTKRRIEQSSFISKTIKVIYDGMDVRSVLPKNVKNERVKVNNDYYNVLMIGNFLSNKGQIQFIKTAALLFEHNKKYRFTIIGNVYDKQYYDACIKQIEDYSLNNVFAIYHGINNASEYIEMFDIQVVPSMYDESFGLISVEAMANGVPVVAFACGGIPEVVTNGRNGFVVPIGECDTMAEKIEYLMNNPNERSRMAEYCRYDYNAKFSTESMINQYVDLLEI